MTTETILHKKLEEEYRRIVDINAELLEASKELAACRSLIMAAMQGSTAIDEVYHCIVELEKAIAKAEGK